MSSFNPKQIIKACKVRFECTSDQEAAEQLNVSPVTISRWRKLELWQKTEAQLVEATIQSQAEDISKD